MLSFIGKRKTEPNTYPLQFWFLLACIFITRSTTSMIWPFVTIYIRQKLDVPVSTAALLLTVQAVASIASTFFIGSAMDRFGRRIPVLFGLLGGALVLLSMSLADSIALWVLLLAIYGAIDPIFSVGVNSMIADMVTQERQRASAYALSRTASNIGVAIGPVIGGILAVSGFELIYQVMAVVYVVIAIIFFALIRETKPDDHLLSQQEHQMRYGTIFRDRVFVMFMFFALLSWMAYAHIFVLMPNYTVENFSLTVHEYSIFLTVNALMVVFFQYGVTRVTSRYRALYVMAVGALFYALGSVSVAWGTALPAFVLSMVIVTLGEMIIQPTALSFVANHAPTQMRARYMGIFELLWPVSAGIGPVIGGYLNDSVSPVATWYGAGLMSLLGVLGFLWMARRDKQKSPQQV